MRASLLLVALVLLAPVVAAQVPGLPQQNACGPLSLVAEPTAPVDPVAIDAPVDVSLVVENQGSIDARVEATASIAEEGWTVEAPDATTVTSGDQATFRFTITRTADATSSATISFLVNGACTPPGNVGCAGTIPVGDPCAMDPLDTQLVLARAPETGFQLPGFLADIQPEYLIAAIVLVGLASAIPFAMRRRKSGLVADCPEPLKMVKPGRGTSFPIELRNTGKDPMSATFDIGPVPEGWSAFMPLPEVQLAGRESRSLWLMVRSPATAAVGETVDVELRMRDVRSNNGGAAVRVRAEVAAGGE